MKKALSIAFSLALLAPLALPPAVFAQSATGTTTNTQALLDQVKQLLTQIQTLQTQINQLRSQQAQATSQISDLLSALKEGDHGEKVKTLQALLAANPEIYPEALITGFYGRLTAEAVKRFQKRHGIEQVGFVGPKTLKKLNELLEEHPITFEPKAEEDRDDDDEDDDVETKRLCAIVPPGHFIAPGWSKKHGGRPIVPPCQVLPPGIAKKLPVATTTIPTDTTAPMISGVAATGIGTSTATIVWTTNEPATSRVYYGMLQQQTTSTLAASVATAVTPGLVTSHSVPLTGLQASTTYSYTVESTDASNNKATSAATSTQQFTTLSQ